MLTGVVITGHQVTALQNDSLSSANAGFTSWHSLSIEYFVYWIHVMPLQSYVHRPGQFFNVCGPFWVYESLGTAEELLLCLWKEIGCRKWTHEHKDGTFGVEGVSSLHHRWTHDITKEWRNNKVIHRPVFWNASLSPSLLSKGSSWRFSCF